MPFFSICIPAYKNTVFLKRLLDSIFLQTYTDYEVVITDDSVGDEVASLIKQYADKSILYFKNQISLGTPENWNEGIRRASGKWIKLMHDDDWFCTSDALQILSDAVQSHKEGFYFSAYNNVYLDEANRSEFVYPSIQRWKRVLKFPPNLYARNVIGPPSVILVRNEKSLFYDNRMKWLVDIDYYIKVMEQQNPVYIKDPLINVGMSNKQVTTYTHNKPEVEIPEGLLLLSKIGINAFKHILYYDAWWRNIRNMNIRDVVTLTDYAQMQAVPRTLCRIVKFQRVIPANVLRVGIFSKACMFLSWLYNRTVGKDIR